MPRSPDVNAFVRLALALLAVIAAAVLVWQLAHVALVVFGAVVVAVLLRSLADPLRQLVGLNEGLALLASGVVVVLTLAAASWLFGATVSHQLGDLLGRLPRDEQGLQVLLERLPFGATLAEQVVSMDGLAGRMEGVAGQVGGYALNVFGAVTNIGLMLVAGVYLALKPAEARDGLLLLFPQEQVEPLRATLNASGRALRLWLLGTFADMVVVAVFTAVGTALIGLPSPLALGLLAGLAAFVPIVGPIVSVVPAVLVAAQEGPRLMLWTVLVYVAVQQIESNLIFPFIQRRAVDLPPVLTLFGVLAFGVLLGPLGVILATPLLVVAMVFITRLYVRGVLGKDVQGPGEPKAAKT